MLPVVGPVWRALGRDLRGAVLDDAAAAGLLDDAAAGPPVEPDDVEHLPEPARRYLGFMGVVGRRRDRTFVARLRGRFRLGRGRWMPCDAWQCNRVDPIGRVFHLRLDVAHVLPMVGRDVYLDGRGAMRGKALGLVTVAEGEGPEFDLGELTTWLNDAVLLAPSMLLDAGASFSPVDDPALADRAFDVTVDDAGLTSTARVLVDDAGRVTDFSSEDRYADVPGGLVRARWSTPVEGWRQVDGRPLPSRARAVWHLDDGPLPYVDGAFASVRYGVTR